MSDERPVWLETWISAGADVWAPGHMVFRGCSYISKEPSTLAAAAPAMVRALLKSEWQAGVNVYLSPECPVCHSLRNQFYAENCARHGAGCLLDSALTAAGFPDQASRDAARARMAEERGT